MERHPRSECSRNRATLHRGGELRRIVEHGIVHRRPGAEHVDRDRSEPGSARQRRVPLSADSVVVAFFAATVLDRRLLAQGFLQPRPQRRSSRFSRSGQGKPCDSDLATRLYRSITSRYLDDQASKAFTEERRGNGAVIRIPSRSAKAWDLAPITTI